MVRNKIEIYCAQMAKNAAFKLYTMVREKFKIYCYQMAKNTSKFSSMVGENVLKFNVLKWLKMHLNCPPWLERIFPGPNFV